MINKAKDQTSLNPAHWNGPEYRRISQFQYTTNLNFLTIHSFSGFEAILDLGCGEGSTTRQIAEKSPHGKVFGVDVSASMIATAKQEKNPNHLHFLLLDMQQLAFIQEFDVITCFFCMQWVPDKKGVFQKIFQSLKPKGYFLLIVPLPHVDLPIIRRKLIKLDRWKRYFQDYSDPLIYINDYNYETYAKDAGLDIISINTAMAPARFSSFNEFFYFMYQMTPHLSCLPNEKEKKAFMEMLLERYLKLYPPTNNGDYYLNFNLVKMYACRQ